MSGDTDARTNERKGRDEMMRSGFARAALAGVALAVLAAPQAQAQEGTFFQSVLGVIGLTDPERPQIDYRERAPLVVPPNLSTLPPPVATDTAAVDPQWPNDPDAAAARARALDARTPAPERAGAFEGIGRTMTPEELARGRLAGAGRVQPGGGVDWQPVDRGLGGANANPAWIPPQTLREGDLQRAAVAPDTRLQRRFLTDPPQRYLQPDPNAAFPQRVETFTGPRPEPQSATDFVREQNAR